MCAYVHMCIGVQADGVQATTLQSHPSSTPTRTLTLKVSAARAAEAAEATAHEVELWEDMDQLPN